MGHPSSDVGMAPCGVADLRSAGTEQGRGHPRPFPWALACCGLWRPGRHLYRLLVPAAPRAIRDAG